METATARKDVPVPDRVRTYRAPDDLYDAAQQLVWKRGLREEGLSGPIRLALRAWVEDPAAFEAACRRILGEE